MSINFYWLANFFVTCHLVTQAEIDNVFSKKNTKYTYILLELKKLWIIFGLYLVDNSKLYSPLLTKTTIKPQLVMILSESKWLAISVRSQWVVFWEGYTCVSIKKQSLGMGYNN